MQVLPTQLIPDEKEGKVLRVRLIQKEGVKLFNPSFLFDEGSTISWIPCGRKLTCSFPGIKFFYGPDTYYGEEVSVHCQHHSIIIRLGFRRVPTTTKGCQVVGFGLHWKACAVHSP